jgi:hypothetical protein
MQCWAHKHLEQQLQRRSKSACQQQQHCAGLRLLESSVRMHCEAHKHLQQQPQRRNSASAAAAGLYWEQHLKCLDAMRVARDLPVLVYHDRRVSSLCTAGAARQRQHCAVAAAAQSFDDASSGRK